MEDRPLKPEAEEKNENNSSDVHANKEISRLTIECEYLQQALWESMRFRASAESKAIQALEEILSLQKRGSRSAFGRLMWLSVAPLRRIKRILARQGLL